MVGTIGRERTCLTPASEDVTTIGDAAFDGLQNYYPERSIGTPHKARRNHPLTPDQKLANHEFSRERIVVENTLSHMKHFKVLAHRFRHAVEIYDDAFRSFLAMELAPRAQAQADRLGHLEGSNA